MYIVHIGLNQLFDITYIFGPEAGLLNVNSSRIYIRKERFFITDKKVILVEKYIFSEW